MGQAETGRVPKKPFWRRHPRWTWAVGVALVVLAALAVAVSVALHRAEPYVRSRIVSALENHFHAHVELDSFHMSLVNGLWAEGKGLRIWPPAPPGSSPGSPAAAPIRGAPLIELAEFRFHAPLQYSPGKPFHISKIELKGLNVNLPPKKRFAHAGKASQPANGGGALARIVVGTIECTDAHLTMETDKPGKLPLEFAIARLRLTNVSAGGAMRFKAELTNPKPVGTIYTQGTFGPWVVDDPGESAVAGAYHFEHANLATFKGIAGILSSTGRFGGTLRDITVDGETDTPDFRLTRAGNPMHLRTRFHAHVDGTDGDTWLEPVDATLGNSHFTAQGKIVRVTAPGTPNGQPLRSLGHDIALTVNVDNGHIEDFLLLTSNDKTPMLTGAITVKTTLDIPPGPARVEDRLKLNGSFTLTNALFTSAKIQGRIKELSLRGQGQPKGGNGADAAAVRSTMQGDFQMAAGVVTLPSLKYIVPGAEIELKGTYGIASGALSFTGRARMQATISQMVGGWKGFLLKPADKIFEKNGAGTSVPIVIGGTREKPDFGIDFGGIKKTSPQRPGGP
ncbi:MAG: hypothetical protein ACRD27_06615 [Terracidiphilus sp.]